MFDSKKLEDFPQKSGVYLMKDASNTVIYVGKAKNLKLRLKQYFAASPDTRPQVPELLRQLATIETIILTSEKEAYLLENTLIKEHRPKYNILLKDDKTYLSFKISKNEWPMMSLARYKGRPPSDGEYFGPFTNSAAARQMFDLIARLFPLRQCSDEEFARRKRPCLLYQIKRCLAPCVNYCTHEEYDRNVHYARKLLKGQNTEIIKELTSQMKNASNALDFEKAHDLHKKIMALQDVQERQKVLGFGANSVDVIGFYRHGSTILICKLIYREARLLGSVHFEFSQIIEEDHEGIESFLLQHYLDPKIELPQEIFLSIPTQDINALMEIIADGRHKTCKLIVPQKGDKKELLLLANENAEAAFKQRKDLAALREKQLVELQDKCHLRNFPRRIECFDNSHLQGADMVSAMVVFIHGQKHSAGYRKFRIRGVTKGDDYAALAEVLERRFKDVKKISDLPDLLIIDGGKGHLQTALRVLSQLNIASVDVIAIAKEAHRHDKGLTQEQIFYAGLDEPLLVERHSGLLLLLQAIRDEAHRFAITFHRSRRKKTIITSALDAIPGIGPMKKRALLRAFGSVKAILAAGEDALCKIKGITSKDAKTIMEFLRKE